jgi:hypothetical protein
LSDRNSCAVANGGTSVPEVLAPAKLESICAVVVVPHIREPAHRPAVGNDEEKAQKLSMHPPTENLCTGSHTATAAETLHTV